MMPSGPSRAAATEEPRPGARAARNHGGVGAMSERRRRVRPTGRRRSTRACEVRGFVEAVEARLLLAAPVAPTPLPFNYSFQPFDGHVFTLQEIKQPDNVV